MKRVLFATLLSVLVLAFAGCSGSGKMPVQMTGTAVTLQAGDATNDQVAKFELTITSITLTGVSPTANTSNLLSEPAEIEFSHLAGTLEPFSLGHIPPGTYSGATMMVSNPELVVVNNGVISKAAVNMTSSTVNITFTSNITVTSTPLFLNFDLDLAKSLDLTQNPVPVTPTFTVTTSTVPANHDDEGDDDGEENDVHGTVQSISAPDFTITTEDGMTVTFATDGNTRFSEGLTQLSDLHAGDIVEVDAVTQSDGTKLATRVARAADHMGEEVEGLISTLDSPLTTITIVHQVDSMNSSNPPTTVSISVNANTQFMVHPDRLSMSAPAFDATHIGKGQRIEADSDTAASPVVATKVKLREQALVGTVSNASSTGFTLTPSPTSAFATLSGATSVAVTFAAGANEVTIPANGSTIRVRGLVFVNGTAYSMIAARSDNHDD
jgi:hypothetical protein